MGRPVDNTGGSQLIQLALDFVGSPPAT